MRVSFVLISSAVFAAACAESPKAPQGFEISVAPLTLPGISDACYTLTVYNSTTTFDATTTVWEKSQVCASDYGDGIGSITYVGTCDASEDFNTVELVLEGLWTGGPFDDEEADELVAGDDYINPCTSADASHTCRLIRPCEENEDTLVEFNLTIMRRANEGFFDIAVNFEDIYCSAKVDCAYPDGPHVGPIELLFHPSTGERAQTAVLGLACTGGPAVTAQAPNDTVLLRDPIDVECGAQTTVIDPTRGVGNAYTAANPDPDLTDAVWQYAVYAGNEDLDCGGFSCNKRYWNVAIGFDPSVSDCTLTTRATAGTPEGLSPDSPFSSPDATAYPVIDIEVRLTALNGGLACSQHPLNTPDSGVATRYTTFDTPEAFCGRFEGGVFACSEEAGCPEPPLASLVSGNVVNDSIANANSPQGLARARNGDLFVAFQDKGDSAAGSKAFLTRSTDGGQTWEQTPHRIFESLDPLVGVGAGIDSLPNGDLIVIATEVTHLAQRSTTIRLYRSNDNGATFTDWQTLDTDPDALTVPMGRIVPLSNGDLIMPAYAYTACCAPLASYNYGSGFFRSTDGGDTWGRLELAFTDPPPGGSFMAFNEAAFVVRRDGSIVAQGRAGSGEDTNLWYVESFDDGQSWTAPQETDVRADFPAVARISDCSYLMVAGELGEGEDRRTVRMFKSRDGIDYDYYDDAPYSHPHDIPNSGNTGGAQAMVRLPDGSFYVAYYSYRHCASDAVPNGTRPCGDPSNPDGRDFYIDGMLLRP